MPSKARAVPVGPTIMAIAALVGLIVSAIDYFRPLSGINYTPGALLVVGSSALLLIGALLLMGWGVRHSWVGKVLNVLMIIGILGTAVAAYFLNSWLLLIATAACFIGWLVHLFWHPAADNAVEYQANSRIREVRP